MDWNTLLADEQQKPYFQTMLAQIKQQRQHGITIYPSDKKLYQALELTPFEQVKVVILGQDPYHGEGQAHGLAFSVGNGIKVPPSLVNIYKELASDIDDFKIPTHGDLTSWAKQGVLLLNTILSVQQGNAHSHAKLGWESYTDKIIELLNQQKQNIVFILWGANAHKKGKFIDQKKHCVLTSVHPSPLSAYRGFLGCRHFSKTNCYLARHQLPIIDWRISDKQLSLLA